MVRRYVMVCFAFMSLVFCSTAFAGPTFEVGTSSNTAEKGHTFQIFVEIKSFTYPSI